MMIDSDALKRKLEDLYDKEIGANGIEAAVAYRRAILEIQGMELKKVDPIVTLMDAETEQREPRIRGGGILWAHDPSKPIVLYETPPTEETYEQRLAARNLMMRRIDERMLAALEQIRRMNVNVINEAYVHSNEQVEQFLDQINDCKYGIAYSVPKRAHPIWGLIKRGWL